MPRNKQDEKIEQWTQNTIRFLNSLPGALFDLVMVWLGYDWFAPLFHLPLANPLNILGAALVAVIVRRQFK